MRTPRSHTSPLVPLLTVACGLPIFAAFAHHGWPWFGIGAAGLLASAAAIAVPAGGEHPGAVLGLDAVDARTVAVTMLALAIGAGVGGVHRIQLGLPLWPDHGPHWFIGLACAIGATEELIYRGWWLGRARVIGWPAAIIAAAAAHAAYKVCLFAWPPTPTPYDLVDLAFWTLSGGIVAGGLRWISNSTLPSVAAHVAFDYVVYAAVTDVPWWVWG